ncbi:hypothetical protein HMPREF1624_03083 [Sporothrix schenckii ATCC 58251]|uniref:DUF7492 domain-containing protein n=1 Tax=Sporothrix schenckii (strain ATCC 58251 / de Perez 2211183) TaxID=1391915 RepID=U7PY99_SPOS1|nr:hypothetical protein HMPREF1624_03083 [Sporothrix schenckii ATCC 58251]
MSIASNGTMTGAPGYIRGYVSRAMPGFSDDMDDFLVPENGRPTGNEILSTDPLCHPSQTIGNYSTKFPMLTVTPGGYIALRYQENGHVTLPEVNPTKPLNRGTVYIYGTTQPSDNELFLDVFQKWTADGTGGNGRGRLLATRNFDDGQCYQINNGNISEARQAQFTKVAENPQGADLWCQNDIQLPSDLVAGSKYTLYWIWNWPTFNAAGSPTDIPTAGYNVTLLQHYTSCMDVSVVAGSGSGSGGSSKAITHNFASTYTRSQDLNDAAVLSQLVNGAFQVEVPGAAAGAGSNSGSGNSTATSPAVAATTKPANTASVNAGGQHEHTIVVTVTETEPHYVTVTVPAGGAPTTTPSSSSTKTGGRMLTVTDTDTFIVTRTREPPSSESSGGVAGPASSKSSPSAASPSTTPSHFTPTPGQSLTVQPFLSASSSSIGGGGRNGTATTLLRVRRS